MLAEQGMGPQQYRAMVQAMPPNGMMVQNELQKRAMANSRNACVIVNACPLRSSTPSSDERLTFALSNPHLQQMRNVPQQQIIQREQGIEMAGQRPQSPMENTPSPKRQRLDGANFNGQAIGPGARGPPPSAMGPQGMHVMVGAGPHPNQMLLQNGVSQGQVQPGHFETFQSPNPNMHGKVLDVSAVIFNILDRRSRC